MGDYSLFVDQHQTKKTEKQMNTLSYKNDPELKRKAVDVASATGYQAADKMQWLLIN